MLRTIPIEDIRAARARIAGAAIRTPLIRLNNARRLGVSCIVVVPDHAPETKLAAITRLGGQIVKMP